MLLQYWINTNRDFFLLGKNMAIWVVASHLVILYWKKYLQTYIRSDWHLLSSSFRDIDVISGCRLYTYIQSSIHSDNKIGPAIRLRNMAVEMRGYAMFEDHCLHSISRIW